jgi:hypothetical protein
MSYRDDLAAIRQERAAREAEIVQAEFNEVADQKEQAERQAREALRQGDRETAEAWVAEADFCESEIAKITQRMERLPQPALSEAKQAWIDQRQDLAANPKLVELAGHAHNYITQRIGAADDSPEYFELMQHALEPPGYQPQPTPDDVCEMLGIDAKTYNAGVRRLWNAKKQGDYE